LHFVTLLHVVLVHIIHSLAVYGILMKLSCLCRVTKSSQQVRRDSDRCDCHNFS